jgi:hypothetical protein
MSKGGRSYSDPSYGSHKSMTFQQFSCGTRSAAILDAIVVNTPMKVIGISGVAAFAGSGSTSAWAVCKNTTALGTLTFATNATAGAVANATVTTTAASVICAVGDRLTLQSGTQTADPNQTCKVSVEYYELFDVSDN